MEEFSNKPNAEFALVVVETAAAIKKLPNDVVVSESPE